MELLSLQNESEIIKYLNKIDELCSKPSIPSKTQKLLLKNIQKTFTWIDKNSQKIDKTISLQLLEFLLYFHKTKDFTQILNNYKIPFIINNNIAYFIQQNYKQKMSQNQNSNYRHIQESIKIVKEERMEICVESESGFYDVLKLDFTLTKSYLQLAASFSHLKDHKRALFCGKKCVFFLNSLLRSIEALFCPKKRAAIGFKFRHLAKLALKLEKGKNLKNAFFCFFKDSKKVNDFCSAFLEFVVQEKSVCEDFKKFENFRICEILKKLKPKWIKKLSIVNFMHIEYVFLERLNLKISFDEIFSEGFLSILISLSCVIYFMISTENRFFLLQNNKLDRSKNFKIKSVFEKNHYEKLKKMKNFVFSELLHSKSIAILQNYFDDNSLLTHFTNSFLKNYQANLILENIQEVEESLLNSTVNLNNSNQTFVEYSFDLSFGNNNKNGKIKEKSKFSILNAKVFEENDSSESEEMEDFDVIKKKIELKTKKINYEKKKNNIDNKNIKNTLFNNLNNILTGSKKEINENERMTIKNYKKEKIQHLNSQKLPSKNEIPLKNPLKKKTTKKKLKKEIFSQKNCINFSDLQKYVKRKNYKNLNTKKLLLKKIKKNSKERKLKKKNSILKQKKITIKKKIL